MTNSEKLPVIFVRELVVFPGMSVTLTVGREATRLTVLESQKRFNNSVVTMTQLRAEDPEINSLDSVYDVGTICRIEKVVALTDGGMQVQIEGVKRFQGKYLEYQDGINLIQGEPLTDKEGTSEIDTQELLESFSTYQPASFDSVAWIAGSDSDELKRINARIAQRQKILEEHSVIERIKLLKELECAKS